MNRYADIGGAPPKSIAADGQTELARYRVEAIIYAPTEGDARGRLEQADVYLDHARLVQPDDALAIRLPDSLALEISGMLKARSDGRLAQGNALAADGDPEGAERCWQKVSELDALRAQIDERHAEREAEVVAQFKDGF